MNSTPDRHLPRSSRGSVLIVALLLAAIIAISLTSFLKLATNTNQMAYRSHYAGVAMNAAESGLEQAMWSIQKKKTGSSSAWSDWDTSSGSTARRTFALGSVSGGASVSVRVLVSDRNLTSSNPYAVARATVTPVNGGVIEKWVKISLQQRSRFSNGLVAKDGLSFSGNNAYVDSYNSTYGAYTPSQATTNRFARGSAGSASITRDSFNVGNADIYGYASVGTNDYTGLDVGAQGKVTGDFNAPGGTVDYTRVSTNFTANFDPVPAPTNTATSLGTVNNSVTLPKNAASDARTTAADGTVTYYYTATSVSLTNKTITVSPGYNVVLTVSGNVSVGGGSGAITVNSTKNTVTSATLTSSLNLYVNGNVNIAGQGAGNTVTTTSPSGSTTAIGSPKNLMIWGTNTSAQTIKVAGNGQLSAVVYAPSADLEMKGGGTSGGTYGAFIGRTVAMTGNEGFHYDESLAGLDSGEPLGISQWSEFVSADDRATYASMMSF